MGVRRSANQHGIKLRLLRHFVVSAERLTFQPLRQRRSGLRACIGYCDHSGKRARIEGERIRLGYRTCSDKSEPHGIVVHILSCSTDS